MSDAALAPLHARLTAAPRLADAKGAKARLDELLRDAQAPLARLLAMPQVRALLLGIADHSAYLWQLLSMDLLRLTRLLDASPEQAFQDCITRTRLICDLAEDEAQIMEALRKAKQEAALLIALADIGGVWDVLEVTQALTSFADAVVSDALRFLLRGAMNAGKLTLSDRSDPEKDCGVVILAMGKHGAGELNYSSDIDLIVFFDPSSPAIPEGAEPSRIFVAMTRTLARLLQERTGDGYVLRVDLRLRPDPGSTAVAISLPAAFSYYEMLGQNWERAALIKARPVAGDKTLGIQLLKALEPFIWRKYFDYAAIADIHAMKRQIHAVRGHAEVAVAGHDVKLGRGGIREVEFFVQTQQLIFGGRRRQLRGARTLDMLRELEADGWVTHAAVEDLTASYLYLRQLEHRLQMVADEQTQRLPADLDALSRFAKFCGHARLSSFETELTKHLRKVEEHYARLFEHAPGLDASTGSLVFTGVVDDPDTLETLANMGFQDPVAAAEIVRGWHFGRRSAVQSARAREILTELIPALLESFAGSGDADAALCAFDSALTGMPAASELFTILKSNEKLRELFGDILGGAPRLARVIAMRPHVLDAAIDPALLEMPTRERTYDVRAGRLLASARSTEAFLDGARDLLQEEMFLIGVRTLSGVMDPVQSGRAYSDLASALLRATFAHVETAFTSEYGQVPGGRCVIIGMGKLGSCEMTAASDLDLILLYDFDPDRPESVGARPLHALQYYTRLTQRFVSALTVATRRGRLYDVDMRLRPSGGKGPIATQMRSFRTYQFEDAETWEHMALTRARIIGGDGSLCVEVEAVIRDVLARPRNKAKLKRDVYDMRRLIAQEKGEDNPFDLKLAAGGIIDVEFVAQYLILRHAHAYPALLDTDLSVVLMRAAEAGVLAQAQADRLGSAHHLYATVTQMVRLAIEGDFNPRHVASGVLRRIAAAANVPDFPWLARHLDEMRTDVRQIFDALLKP